jgi:hypothetical protein
LIDACGRGVSVVVKNDRSLTKSSTTDIQSAKEPQPYQHLDRAKEAQKAKELDAVGIEPTTIHMIELMRSD